VRFDDTEIRPLREFMGDVEYGMRLALRQSAFSALVVATMATGIGVLAATFSLLNAVLLRPLPYAEPDRLISIQLVHPEQGTNLLSSSVAYLTLIRETRTVGSLAAALPLTLEVESGDSRREVDAAFVSLSFFEVFPAHLRLGRPLIPADGRPGDTRAVLISQRLWHQVFGSDPAIIGKIVHVSGGDLLTGAGARLSACTIVGVLPPDFTSPFASRGSDIWIAEAFDNPQSPERAFLFARLGVGVTLEEAAAELEAIHARLERDSVPDSLWRLRLVPLREFLAGGLRRPLHLLLLGGLLLLLVAIVNTSILLSARTRIRTSEAAIRAMLGASRTRLVSQFLAEGLVLVVPSGILGLFLTYGVVGLFRGLGAVGIPSRFEVNVDGRVVAFAVLVSAGAVVLFALLPAFRFSKLGSADILTGSTTESARTAAKGGAGRLIFVALQIAIALTAAVTSMLLFRSFANLLVMDPGFTPSGVTSAWLTLPRDVYPETGDRVVLHAAVLGQLRSLPDVSAVGLANYLPLSRGTGGMEFAVENSSDDRKGDRVAVAFTAVSPGYLETMRIPLVAGRYFEEPDLEDIPLVISEKAARLFWGNGSALGKRLIMGGKESGNPWSRVIGVVKDVRHDSLSREGEARVYVPLLGFSQMALVARSRSGDPEILTTEMRKTVQKIDASLSLLDIQTMQTRVDSDLSTIRMSFSLMMQLAATTLLLAAVGIYSAVWYSVVDRAAELRIRVALGAQPRDIVGLMFRKAVPWVLAGVCVGVGGSLALRKYLASLLFQVSTLDWLAFSLATIIVGAVATFAIYLPARRAARLEPRLILHV
jgi:putative ABC transport system permease protein